MSTANTDCSHQRWTHQLLRRSTLLPRASVLKLVSLPLVSGASLLLTFGDASRMAPTMRSCFGFTKFTIRTKLSTPCGDVIECNVHISLASHTYLRKVCLWLVALAPQIEFELLKGMHAATKHHLDKTSGSLYCVQSDLCT